MSDNGAMNNGVLAKARSTLDQGDWPEALELLRRQKNRTPDLQNAYGVCLMRAGETEHAVEVFRGLTLHRDGLSILADAPVVYKTNFATALLLAGNPAGCMATLNEIGDEGNPSVMRLRRAIADWKRSMSPFRRLLLALNGLPSNRKVPLPFPPGEC
jgi:hypothetical protein